MSDSTITWIFALAASAVLGWLIGHWSGVKTGRAIGWLERYYAEIDAQARRIERFNATHPRINGQFAEVTREEEGGRN